MTSAGVAAPAPKHRVEKSFTWVHTPPAIDQVPSRAHLSVAELEKQLAGPRPYSYTAKATDYLQPEEPAAAASVVPDPITIEQCRAEIESRPGQQVFYRNRFNYCFVGYAKIAVRECRPVCEDRGFLEFRVTAVFYGTRGVREDGATEMRFKFATDRGRVQDVAPPDWDIVAFMVDCRPIETESCDQDPASDVTEIGTLRTGTFVSKELKLSDRTPGVAGRDVKNYYELNLSLKWGFEGLAGPKFVTRCDKTNYEDKGGCVFMDVAPRLGYSRSVTEWSEFIKHIEDAQSGDITRTVPGLPGTEIPGSRASTKQLTRLPCTYDSARCNRNNYHAVKTCKATWGEDYATNAGYPRECDEYPFKSTYEGADYNNSEGISSKWSYSARAMRNTHNNLAGRALGSWYREDHLIDRDGFWVDLIP
ncbi:NucA/NucB deoxyribonuclease domain-containing protein [Allokutzneria albata]|uniref:NucA/NucB deoxyribonuclease domain-containing protein n=1 Tax=Allokutzneria albata TaxID=211114 RepID=UPI0004C43409|nr:hypothetical protein [Allokutzneria albata]